MAVAGNLQDMSFPTLVQSAIQEGGHAYIKLQRDAFIGSLYITDGQLYHAELTHQTDSSKVTQTGEEVIYELLSWTEGDFSIERNITSANQSIEQSWNYLLMEGLRKIDEVEASVLIENLDGSIPENEELLLDMLQDLSAEDAAAIQVLANQHVGDNEMASKSEQLKEVLQNVVNNSTDLSGAVVVDNDGLLLASVLNSSIDNNRIAAVSAGLISLAGRSSEQLGQGAVKQTLIKAENGNIIALRAGSRAAFVALTPTDANLGMVFIECQDAAAEITKIM